jgi:hypothetical protein
MTNVFLLAWFDPICQQARDLFGCRDGLEQIRLREGGFFGGKQLKKESLWLGIGVVSGETLYWNIREKPKEH